MKGCMPSTVKYLLFTINFLVMLMGLVVLGFSIYSLVDGRGVSTLVEEGASVMGEVITVDLYSSASIVLIIFSSLIVLLSFLGCCGAWKENRFLIFLYFALLLIVFLGTVVGATITTYQNLDILKNPLLNSMSKYDPNSKDQEIIDINTAWNDVQSEFSCCGVNNFEDWVNVTSIYPDKDRNLVPDSCCTGLTGTDLDFCRKTPGESVYADRMKGCFAQFQQDIADNKDIILIVSATIIAFLFVNLLVLFGFALCLTPRHAYHEV